MITNQDFKMLEGDQDKHMFAMGNNAIKNEEEK
jgi:hypothetical protein